MRGAAVGSVALLAVLGSLVLGGPAAPAATGTVSYVVMYSDGDWVGGGTQREFDARNSSLSVSGSPGYLTVNVSGGTAGDYFSLDFAAQPGDILTSGGIYTNAQRAPFREASHPGIDIYGDGRGCNTDSGQFEVKDIATDSSGSISRLWIVYEQHCEGGRAALWGEVKLNEPAPSAATVALPGVVRWPTTDVGAPNTVVPVTVIANAPVTINGVSLTGTNASDFAIRANECSGLALAAGDSCQVWLRFVAAAAGVGQATVHITDSSGGAYDVSLQGFAYGGTTSVTMTSDAGDYIGQAKPWSYSLANGDEIGLGGGRTYAGFGVNGANGDWWSADFVPAQGDILVPGATYANATRYPFNGSGPGLDVSGMGRGCNTLTGSFTVNSATFNADGTLKTASISFVQHCEGATAALHGTWAFRAGDNTAPAPWMIATTPVPAPPPSPSPPSISSFSPSSGAPGTSVTITGANFSGATAVTFGGAGATFSVDSSTQITATVPQGASTGAVAVMTGAGTGTSSTTFTVTPPPAPAIGSFTPTSGTAGTAVTITGTNFTGATGVTFGGASAAYTVSSPTQITATVPQNASTGAIAVTTGAGTAASSTSFTVTAPPPPAAPAITSFSPASAAPGTTVTISGTSLAGATAVAFNGAAAVFNVISATQIQTVVPAGSSTGKVTVTTAGGTATSATDFVVTGGPPSISSFSPTTGAAGTTVTITGTNFTSVDLVSFGGASALYSVVSPTELHAAVPAGAASGKIVVATSSGSAQSATDFTVTSSSPPPPPAAPAISSFSPSSGASGTSVTITGANFASASAVSFAGTAATYTVVSATQITATVPAAAASGRIGVTTPGGTAQSTSDFTVTTAAPEPPPSGGGGGGGGGGGSSGIPPDLHVTAQASAATAPAPGGELDFTITVTTVSVGGTSDARLDLTLPAGYAVTRVVADRGPGCGGTAPALSCDVGWINPNASTTVVVFGTVGQAGAQKLTATATSLLEPELNAADNTAVVELAPASVPAPTAPFRPPASKTVQVTLVSRPAIAGAHRVGALLHARAPRWNAPAQHLRYSWQLCSATACIAISRQHSATLLVGRAAAGRSVRLVVAATVSATAVTVRSATFPIR